MRRTILVLLLAAAATGCATPYKPPSEPAPPGWTGVSGMKRLGPILYRSGVFKAEGVVSSMAVAYVRTGVLAEPVKLMTAYGGTMRLPEGSKAYATNYGVVTRQPGGPRNEAPRFTGPIEWCIIVENGFDGLSGVQTACAFWESPQRARYIDDSTDGGLPFEPYITIGGTAGMPGSVPKITEQPVDFGVALKREVKIRKVNARTLTLHVMLTDGVNSRVLRQYVFDWSQGEEVLFEDMVFRKVAGDAAAVEVARAS